MEFNIMSKSQIQAGIEKVCERFGQRGDIAEVALADYKALWPARNFEVTRVPGIVGIEFAIVQHVGVVQYHTIH